jgi:peptidoglycan/LPS O-acetylase OafA/YrhL
MERVKGLDGLRAQAIMLVIAWHAVSATRFPTEALGPLRHLVMMGWAGVDLFFGLSGFLITSILLREETIHLGQFYLRRALRILPVFLVVMALDTWLFGQFPQAFPSVHAWQLHHDGSALGVAPYVTLWGNYFAGYMQGWFSRPVYDPGEAYLAMWSLAVEEHFYLLWPLVLVAIRSRRARVVVAGSVCLLLPILRFALYRAHLETPQRLHSLTHYRIDSILWGALAALTFEQTRRFALPAMGVGLVALVALVASGDLSVVPSGSPLGLGLGFTALALTSAALVVHVRQHQQTRLVRVLESRPLALTGRLSYAMYLIHLPMIDLGRRVFFAVPREATLANFGLALVLFVSLTVAAAGLLHLAVERPFLRLKTVLARAHPRSDLSSER